MADRVRVTKYEYSSKGGDASDETEYLDEIDPNDDGLDGRSLFLQNDSSEDSTVEISRDGSNPDNMIFKDEVVTTAVTLTDLLAGSGGITEDSHKTLRQLIHLAEQGGPWDEFSTVPYWEPKSGSGPWNHGGTWWESSSKSKKIVEKTINRNANKTPSTIVWIVYDTDGSTALVTATDAYSYSGGTVDHDSVTRTFA